MQNAYQSLASSQLGSMANADHARPRPMPELTSGWAQSLADGRVGLGSWLGMAPHSPARLGKASHGPA